MTKPEGRARAGDGPDDSALVERALHGDQEAFASLVRQHQRLVFRIVGGFLRNRADVEEVAQEAFLRAFKGLSGFKAGASFGPWIARIATRVSYDRLRQRRYVSETGWDDLTPAEEGATRQAASGGDPVDRTAARDLLERAMGSLAPKDRQILLLVDAQGFSTVEAAEIMGCTALAARVRLHRSRRAVRKSIGSLMDTLEGSRG